MGRLRKKKRWFRSVCFLPNCNSPGVIALCAVEPRHVGSIDRGVYMNN